jgi:hypothetical protein
MSLNCDAKKEEKKKKIQLEKNLKICTKQRVNIRMRCGNGSPE